MTNVNRNLKYTLLSSDKEWPTTKANFTGANQKVEKINFKSKLLTEA